MIHVAKNLDDVPAGLTSKKARERVTQLLAERNEHHFSSRTYRHATVLQKLNMLYHHKCAYCEAKTGHGAAFQVEHYRPIDTLKDVDDHPGYYWLAYEWSNLLLACPKCNRSKSNAFPIKGKRVAEPWPNQSDWVANATGFRDEKAGLLHPEIDDPGLHLCFSNDGRVNVVADSYKGRQTIDLCKLNRDALIIARKSKFQDLVRRFKACLTTVSQLEKELKLSARDCDTLIKYEFQAVFDELVSLGQADQEFSRLGTEMFQHFESWIVHAFKEKKFRSILMRAYRLCLPSA